MIFCNNQETDGITVDDYEYDLFRVLVIDYCVALTDRVRRLDSILMDW